MPDIQWLITGLGVAVAILAVALLVVLAALQRLRQSVAGERRIIDNLTEGVYRSSIDGKQLSANRSLVELNGYESEAEMLRAVNSIADEWYVDPDRRRQFHDLMMRDGRVIDFVSEIYRHKTREKIWISENAQLIRHPQTGEPLYFEGTVREVTDMVRRRRAEERLNKLAANIPGGMFQLRREKGGRFTAPYISEPFYRVLGMRPSGPVFRPENFLHVIDPEDLNIYFDSLAESGKTLTEWRCEFRVSREIVPEGRWLRVLATPERDAEGTVIWHGFLSDITGEKRMQKHVEYLAYYDPLTDLPNRRLMLDRIEQTRSASRRRGKHAGLLFIDLDDFKIINDTHGHDVGDTFIRKVGKTISESVRESDTVARFGGDEFVVLLQDVGEDVEAAEANAMLVAEKVLEGLRAGFALEGQHRKVSGSVGVTTFIGKTDIADEIVRRADSAMYAAKKKGRACAVLHTAKLDKPAKRNAA